ncbi:ABC transporter ATP-binding protein [Rubellimicrobium aerolatum]|uniref:ABC transporter ATP-binding protein n=1 Tax=Rubellimicrobium aerolatum TaxID=490979 RepID=A0ABW0SCC7_9RHOB|nr:ATP-binding cassette domain-containing protein [Rubellimicrobium aerolatum]MBP1806349.1 iron complex transport system ATP-binding protein [Rubellimicrobium aerolatum]
MIEILGVSHAISGRPILSDVTLRLPSGGVTALIGPNGAGKSTLLSLMARLQKLQAGRISFDGLDVTRTPTDRLALKLAILRQDTVFGARLTLRDLVEFGRYPHHRGRPGSGDRAKVEQALALFGLHDLGDRYADEVSGGQRQRALVAMTFAQETDYLLLDEPLNNLDMAHARHLMRTLREVADRHGRTVVVVIHEVNYAAAHADRIVALKEGRLAFEGAPAEVLTEERLGALYGTPVPVRQVDGRPVALHYG